jgi:sec-independent protein translocase protein TatA
MFDSGIEILIIIVAILILFGSAKKIPEFARSLGRATGEFKRGQMELQNEMKKAAYDTPEPPAQKMNYSEAAKALGIDPTNKSDEQLIKEINEKTKIN